MTHVETLKVMRDFYDGSVLKHPEKVAALEAAIAALEAVNHLSANHYDHHTPHMICIPTDEWKAAMNLLPADAVGGE